MSLPLYLDYNATTPVIPEVADAMEPYLREQFGNPSSRHTIGQRAHEASAAARARVAALIGAWPGEIHCTGSATEAKNLAILGVTRALRESGRHLITSAVEHPSVAAPMGYLREQGWETTVLPVDATGRVAPADLAAVIRDDTVLVSLMHANNKVGTLQPIKGLAAVAKEHGVLFHTDAAQSTGKIAVDAGTLGADLLILAGHKVHAPKGIGALYVRDGTPLQPISFGAGQERGLRPGTENVSHFVSLGAAAELARRDALHRRLSDAIPDQLLTGHPEERLPNTLDVSFPGVSGRDLLAWTPSVAASVGSACCHEGADSVSHGLGAMGNEPIRALGAVRLSIGEPTTDEEIRLAADTLATA